MKARFGLQYPIFHFGSGGLFAETLKAARKAEAVGFDSFWLMDHVMQIPQMAPRESPILDAWTTLSAVAAQTTEVRLGTFVTCNSLRHPSILAKACATVDIVSRGRSVLGLGAGWFEEEHASYGWPFASPRVRLEQLDESLQLMRSLWTGGAVNFEGAHYRVSNALCIPTPLQKPHPPILIGGGGERVLNIAAKHADMVSLYSAFSSPSDLERKIAIFETHCKHLGRDPGHIRKIKHAPVIISQREAEAEEKLRKIENSHPAVVPILRSGLIGTPERCLETIESFVKIGIDYFVLYFPSATWSEDFELFAREILPMHTPTD